MSGVSKAKGRSRLRPSHALEFRSAGSSRPEYPPGSGLRLRRSKWFYLMGPGPPSLPETTEYFAPTHSAPCLRLPVRPCPSHRLERSEDCDPRPLEGRVSASTQFRWQVPDTSRDSRRADRSI